LADRVACGQPARVMLCGLAIDAVTRAATVRRMIELARSGRGGWVVTVNLDILRQIAQGGELLKWAEHVDYWVADGMPLIWASRLQGRPLPERVCGSDLIWDVPAAAAQAGLRIFLLGGNPGAADRAAERLRARVPALEIATHTPSFGFEADPAAMGAIRHALRRAEPHIVLVALGSPRQERLIATLRTEFPGVCWMGCGYAFSFAAGDSPRAPGIWQRLGLEWLHRLLSEPRRLWRRYLLHDLPFAVRLFADAWRRRREGRA